MAAIRCQGRDGEWAKATPLIRWGEELGAPRMRLTG